MYTLALKDLHLNNVESVHRFKSYHYKLITKLSFLFVGFILRLTGRETFHKIYRCSN